VVVLLLAGTLSASYLALQATAAAGKAEQALRQKEAAEKRARETALRVVIFLRKHPEVAGLPAKELVRRFLEANTDLTEVDLQGAFPSVPQSSDTGEPARFSPSMLGD
jgi:hypothetical protein